uniref:Uncharacterized protein n=2 Tax=Lygus hesperus TaxID=30085 RepID=A0A0A9WHM9_LYGHE
MYFMPAYEYVCVDERCPTTHWLFDEGFRTYTADCEKSKGSGGTREVDDQDEPTPRNQNLKQTMLTTGKSPDANFARAAEERLPPENCTNPIGFSKGNDLGTEEANSEPVTTPVMNCQPSSNQTSSDIPIHAGRLQTNDATESSDYEETEIMLTTTNLSAKAPITIGVTENNINSNSTTAKINDNRTATTFLSDDVSDERWDETSSGSPL